MCVPLIVDYISDYELGVFSNNTGVYYYSNLEEVKNFSQKVISELKVIFREKFQMISYTKKKVKANIFGKFHSIEIDYDDSADTYKWIVIVGSDDDDY